MSREAPDGQDHRRRLGNHRNNGPIAQLGARLNGIEKVGGSNPPGSIFIFKPIEKVDPYQGAAHGFESLWVHFLIHIEKVGPYRAGSTFIGAFFIIVQAPFLR